MKIVEKIKIVAKAKLGSLSHTGIRTKYGGHVPAPHKMGVQASGLRVINPMLRQATTISGVY